MKTSKKCKDSLEDSLTDITQRDASFHASEISLEQIELFKTFVNNIQEDHAQRPTPQKKNSCWKLSTDVQINLW